IQSFQAGLYPSDYVRFSMSESVLSPDSPHWDTMAASGDHRGRRGRPDWSDIAFFLLLAVGAAYTLFNYNWAMDYYEKLILVAAVPFFAWVAWLWHPMRNMMLAAGITALLAIWLYSGGDGLVNGDITRSESVFLLKYLFSSQSAVLWMCALFVLATISYWVGFVCTID